MSSSTLARIEVNKKVESDNNCPQYSEKWVFTSSGKASTTTGKVSWRMNRRCCSRSCSVILPTWAKAEKQQSNKRMILDVLAPIVYIKSYGQGSLPIRFMVFFLKMYDKVSSIPPRACVAATNFETLMS